jgi:outer membrane receptor protein involved in Fe transport
MAGHSHRSRLLGAFLAAGILCAAWAAPAQAAPSGSLAGIVQDTSGRPLSDAVVTVSGPIHMETRTGGAGEYAFANLPPGIYEVVAAKPGFITTTISDVTVLAPDRTNVTVSMASQSFSTLRTIAQVSSRTASQVFNNSPSSIAIIGSSTIADQRAPTLMALLDEVPGVSTLRSPASAGNPAGPALDTETVRGGLRYETATLIDGHPMAEGLFGSYYTSQIGSGPLGSIEVVKGPSPLVPLVSGSINGIINYKTREPSAKFVSSVDIIADPYGGLSSDFSASGTLNKKFGFVVDYGINGTPGPLVNTNFYEPITAGWLLNGSPVAAATNTNCTPAGSNTLEANCSSTALAVTPQGVTTRQTFRSELLKLKYAFSGSTALTLAYYGNQNYFRLNGTIGAQTTTTFAPGASYNGSLASGAQPTALSVGLPDSNYFITAPMYEGEFRTQIANGTLLARYYTAVYGQYLWSDLQAPTWSGLSQAVYGTVQLCPPGTTVSAAKCVPAGGGTSFAPTVTTFNGSPATITVNQGTVIGDQARRDRLGGGSVQYTLPIGNNAFTIAADQSDDVSYTIANAGALHIVSELPGSGTRTTSYLFRGVLNPTANLSIIPAVYLDNYVLTYSPDGSTLTSGNLNHVDPRIGISYRPSDAVAWRFTAGSSIAPPYTGLIGATSKATPSLVASSPMGPYYSETLAPGLLLPETAFGYDFGSDMRYGDGAILSWDVYRTNLWGQFVQTNQQVGTFNGSGGVLPLYITQQRNLGTSRYEGVELSLTRAPNLGFGYQLQGALTRAYAYNIPASFYATPTGPVAVNFGLVPGVNYTIDSLGSSSSGSIPYSSGFGSLSYRWRNSGLLAFYTTYYGPNNSWNNPAFFVSSLSARIGVAANTTLQASVENLFDVYNSGTFNQYGGVPAIAVNGNYYPTASGTLGPRRATVVLHHTF